MSASCCSNSESSSQTSATGMKVEVCCELHPPTTCGPARCPMCGELGKSIKRLTLGALLKPEHRAQIPVYDEFCFCRTPTCDVVYFLSDKILFRKNDLSVRVGLKEPRDFTVPVCYCFGWTPEKIWAEIKNTGNSTVIDQIKIQVKSGNCYCEVTNPQGSCCLGNVSQAVKEALDLFARKS